MNVICNVAWTMTSEAAVTIIGDIATRQVHRPIVTDVLEAIGLGPARKLSFRDAMILMSARGL